MECFATFEHLGCHGKKTNLLINKSLTFLVEFSNGKFSSHALKPMKITFKQTIHITLGGRKKDKTRRFSKA